MSYRNECDVSLGVPPELKDKLKGMKWSDIYEAGDILREKHDFMLGGRPAFQITLPMMVNTTDRSILTSLSKGIVVEIGCYSGASSLALLRGAAEHVISIDLMVGVSNDFVTCPMDVVRGVLIDRCSKFGGSRWSFIQGDSAFYCNMFADNSLDLVFLDGAHDFASINKDIEGWWPKVKDGGIMCGHDFEPACANIPPEIMEEVKWLPIYHGMEVGVYCSVLDHFSHVDLPDIRSTVWVARKDGNQKFRYATREGSDSWDHSNPNISANFGRDVGSLDDRSWREGSPSLEPTIRNAHDVA